MKTCKAGLHQYEGRRCKECQKEDRRRRHQANYQANPEKEKERARLWRQANPEKVKEYQRRWAQANQEKVKERNRRWCQANQEKRRDDGFRRYQANHEKDKERRRRWNRANPEKVKERNRRWRQANPEKKREAGRRAIRSADRTTLASFLETFTTPGGRIVAKALYADWVRFAHAQLAEAGSQASFTRALRKLRMDVRLSHGHLVGLSLKEVPF